MAANIKGITVEIGGNTEPLQKALEGVNKKSKDIQSELKQVDRLLKLDPGNTDLIAQKQKLLAEAVANTGEKLNTLRAAEKQVQDQFKKGEISEDQYRALQREIINAENNLESLESQAIKTNAVLSKDDAIGNLKKIGAAAGVAAVAAGAALVGMAGKALESADEIQRLSDVTGMSAERLQELQYAGNNLGVELETITGAQAKLTKTMADASEGETKFFETIDKTTNEIVQLSKSGASWQDILKRLNKEKSLTDNFKPEEIKKFAKELKNGKLSADDLWTALAEGTDLVNENDKAFAKLGVHVKDAVSGKLRDSKDVMLETIDALGKIENETERDALAMQLFGKSAMELNPLIKAGSEELNKLTNEAKANGAVMSDEAIAGLDSFGDTMDNLKNSVLGTFGEKFAEIAPKLQEFIEKLREIPQWIKENSDLLIVLGVIIGTITSLVIAFNIQQALLAGGMTLWTAIAGIATTITTGLGVAFTFLTSPIALVIIAIGAVIAIGILLYKNWDTVKAKAGELWEKLKTTFAGIKDSVVDKWTEIISGIKNVWNNVVDFFKSLPSETVEFGKNIIEGLIKGIKNKINAIKDAIKEVTDAITGKVKDLLGIHSPSRVMMEFGEFTGEGLAIGIGKTISEVKKATAELANGIKTTMSEANVGSNNIGSASSNTANKNVTINVDKYVVQSSGDNARNLSQLQFLAAL